MTQQRKPTPIDVEETVEGNGHAPPPPTFQEMPPQVQQQAPTPEQLMAALKRERQVRQTLEQQVAKLFGEVIELQTILAEMQEAQEAPGG